MLKIGSSWQHLSLLLSLKVKGKFTPSWKLTLVHISQSTSTSPFISSKTLSAAGRNVSINAQSFDVCSLEIEQSQAPLYSSIRRSWDWTNLKVYRRLWRVLQVFAIRKRNQAASQVVHCEPCLFHSRRAICKLGERTHQWKEF